MQAQNYAKKKADEVDRKKLFEEALGKFRSSDIEGVRPPLPVHLPVMQHGAVLASPMPVRSPTSTVHGTLCSDRRSTAVLPDAPCRAAAVQILAWPGCMRDATPAAGPVRPELTCAALQALVDFENVISTEPRGFRGDDGTRFTQVYRVAQYNIACCYSTIGQAGPCCASPGVPSSLSALCHDQRAATG